MSLSIDIANVEILEDYIKFNDQIIDYFDLLAFWEDVRDNKISYQMEILKKYFGNLSSTNFEKLIEILNRISYINLSMKDEQGVSLLMYQPFKRQVGLAL